MMMNNLFKCAKIEAFELRWRGVFSVFVVIDGNSMQISGVKSCANRMVMRFDDGNPPYPES